jgi:hypothetical protein
VLRKLQRSAGLDAKEYATGSLLAKPATRACEGRRET